MSNLKSPIAPDHVSIPENGNPSEYFVIKRSDDNLVLSRSAILEQPLRTMELGVLVYIIALTREFPNDPISIWSVISHFEHDKPLDVLYAIKGLVVKGVLEHANELDSAIYQMLKATHKAEIQ